MDYDALGRPVRQQRQIGVDTYVVQRAYDGPSGALTTITYPDGDTVGAAFAPVASATTPQLSHRLSKGRRGNKSHLVAPFEHLQNLLFVNQENPGDITGIVVGE